MEIQHGIARGQEAGNGDVVGEAFGFGRGEGAARGDPAEGWVGGGGLSGEGGEFGGEDVEDYVQGVAHGDGDDGAAWGSVKRGSGSNITPRE